MYLKKNYGKNYWITHTSIEIIYFSNFRLEFNDWPGFDFRINIVSIKPIIWKRMLENIVL